MKENTDNASPGSFGLSGDVLVSPFPLREA